MTFVQFFVFCCFIGASFARTDQEVKQSFLQQVSECSKEITVSGEEIQKIKKLHTPENKNAMCLVKCVLQKKGMVDDKGVFDESSSLKMTETEYEGDKDKIEGAKKLYELCKKVNEAQENDDEEGCLRATRLSTCFTENAPKMGFSLN